MLFVFVSDGFCLASFNEFKTFWIGVGDLFFVLLLLALGSIVMFVLVLDLGCHCSLIGVVVGLIFCRLVGWMGRIVLLFIFVCNFENGKLV